MANLAGFQISYELRTSSLGPEVGSGIFTKQKISKGQLIWKYCKGVNVYAYNSKEEVEKRLHELDTKDQEFFATHVYLYDSCVNEIQDDGKFWNHVG